MKFVQEERHFQVKFWLDLHNTGGVSTSSAEIQKYYRICIHVETFLVHKPRDPDRDRGMNFFEPVPSWGAR